MNNNDKYEFEIKLPTILPVKKTEHFNIYYYPNSFAEKELEHIAIQREKAYEDILLFFNVTTDIGIDLYLFNDAETKEAETGHRGVGWAFDNVMAEIYNETTKCHPYHELVHVITDKIFGTTVSFFSEGLAVYISNYLMNQDFGDYINYNIHDKVLASYRKNELFSLRDMFSLQIGESVSKPKISYPQAGSIIGYLYRHLGKERFLQLYKELNPDYTEKGINENIQIFEKYCNMTIGQANKEWLNIVA